MLISLIGSTSSVPPDRAHAAANLPFRDIADSYAREAIIRLYNQHLIDGIGNGLFAPTNPITRAEMATLIGRAFGLEKVDSAIPAFTDVKREAWHYGWVQAAVQTGIVSGVTVTRFEPNRLVSRQEAAVMLARALKQSRPPGTVPGRISAHCRAYTRIRTALPHMRFMRFCA